MQINQTQLHQLQTRFSNPDLFRLSAGDLIPFLEASEYSLIQIMIANNIWQPPPPPMPPAPVVPTNVTGDPEFGLVPYWIHNPPREIEDFLNGRGLINQAMKFLWDHLAGLVPTQIDSVNYQALLAAARGPGLVGPDGTIFGEATYEQLDSGWLWALIDYLWVQHVGGMAQFKASPASPIQLSGGSPNQVTLALVSDWGTGDATASSIMTQIVSLKPDYIIHLGDVYYAGTGGAFLPLGEEQNNLVRAWPQGFEGRSFTLNSNHEMYSGAEGYYNALSAPNSPYSAQNQASYFALQYGGWTVLGLDSAYYSPSPMRLKGSIGRAQAQWTQTLGLASDKVIVLTHHNGLSYNGSGVVTNGTQSLWGEINAALKGDPFAWYWGHVHDGIVYTTPTVAGSNTLARCLGHGALPYGNAYGLKGAQHVAWYAHAPQPDSLRVYNGFVLLTLGSQNGQVASIKEEFYQQGSQTSVWSETIYPPSQSST